MTGWFSRRSGSRVSIQNPVRRVLRAPSLSRNPMPPRTTRKSNRRKASDRTMVGTAQPVCLSASRTKRRRSDSTMNLRKRKIHRVSFHCWGWTARPFSLCLAVAGEAFVLTSPFIERDSRKRANDCHPAPLYIRLLFAYTVAHPRFPGMRYGFRPYSRCTGRAGGAATSAEEALRCCSG